MRIYLAAPFFNEAECKALDEAERILRERGCTVFSPREHKTDVGAAGTPAWSKATFLDDLSAINWCEVVVMLYWGNNSDTGTAWECGYAYAAHKPVVVVQLGEVSNIMIHEGCHTNLVKLDDLKTYDFAGMPRFDYSGKMS